MDDRFFDKMEGGDICYIVLVDLWYIWEYKRSLYRSIDEGHRLPCLHVREFTCHSEPRLNSASTRADCGVIAIHPTLVIHHSIYSDYSIKTA